MKEDKQNTKKDVFISKNYVKTNNFRVKNIDYIQSRDSKVKITIENNDDGFEICLKSGPFSDLSEVKMVANVLSKLLINNISLMRDINTVDILEKSNVLNIKIEN